MKKGSLHLYLLNICNKKPPKGGYKNWWRGEDLNFRPSGYEPKGIWLKFTGSNETVFLVDIRVDIY